MPSDAQKPAQDSEKVLRIIERLENEVASLRKAQVEPIAVVGVSCRFPGAESPDAFWSRLRRGEESTSEVPKDRWNVDALYSADPDTPGKMSTRYGGFLDGIDQFDASFFNITPREAMLMDPQQRLLLELSWEALEDAGLSPDALYGSPSGVFVGVCASDYCRMALENVDNVTAYLGTGNATSVVAGRLSYTFGFSGPCVSLDTACSSALVAVHYAAESLRKGECHVALAASANVILAPEITVAFSKARMMAPDGRCKTFDERADGYVRAEGAAVLVLKTLSRARADGDRILAIVRGTAINQDGASGGLTVPNGPSQTALVRQALSRAGVKPADVDYIEAHGTGTALGDPIEVGALAEVFAATRVEGRPLLLGSVKTLLGHLEVAAGMAGLIKVILSLENETVPGYPHLQELSSRIPWAKLPFVVPREPLPWTRGPKGGKPRIAGVSAFGFSGTNAHVVVQEAPRAERGIDTAESQPAYLLCLSAKTPDALAAMARRYADWLGEHPDATLDEVCWTAANGRARLAQRLAVTAGDPESLREKLVAFAETKVASGKDVQLGAAPAMPGPIAFLFTGQGSQYAEMGKELYDRNPAFRATIARCEAILASHVDVPLRDVLWGEQAKLLNRTRYTQPALFALEYAIATLWRSWGIEPSYVMGHSVGELAAACFAGVFDLEDGLKLIAARGRLMDALPEGGAMAVVLAGRDAVEPTVVGYRDRLSIAGLNAPDQTVVSGERAAVLEVCERLSAEQGIRNRGLLDVSHAFHSALMRPILAELRAVAETVKYRTPAIDVVSNVTGTCAPAEMATAEYWVNHVLAPVDFMAGVRALESNRVAALVEVGPTATLIGLARACADEGRFVTAASLRPKVAPWTQMLECLGTLFVHGFSADPRKAGRCQQPPPARRGLPTYPFQRQRHWIHAADGSGVSRHHQAARGDDRHPLLGRRLRSAALPAGDLQFEATLATDSPAYLRHHRVYGKVVVPAAGYVEMALAGIRREIPNAAMVLHHVSVQAALVLRPDAETVVQTHYADAGGNRYRFKIASASAGDHAGFRLHVSGEVEVLPEGGDAAPAIDAKRLHERFEERGEPLGIAAFYDRYAALGLQYGGEFRSVVELRRIDGDDAHPAEILARIRPPEVSPADSARHVIHPALLDGCFQAVGAMVSDGADVVFLPVGIESLRPWQRLPDGLWAHGVLRRAPSAGDPRVVADLRLIDDDGNVVCVVAGLQAVRVDRRALAYATATWKDKLYTLGWAQQGIADAPAPADGAARGASRGLEQVERGEARRWLVLGDGGGAGAALKALIESDGHACSWIREDDVDRLDKASWSRVLAEQSRASDVPLAGIAHLFALDESLDEARAEAGGSSSLERTLARSCGSALALVQALMDVPNQRLPRLWLFTRGAQAVVEGEPVDAAQSSSWGLGRTIALEHPALGCTCVDIEGRAPTSPSDSNEWRAIADDLLHPDAELQVAYRAGKRYVARLNRAPSGPSKHGLEIPGESYRLRISEYGSLERLTLLPAERREPAGGEVEIDVCASAINFKDVLYGLGMLQEFSERAGIRRAIDQPLGFECAGRIVRVGPAVTGLAAGDEVFAMAPSAMASHVTIDQRLVHRKPSNVTFEQAASIPAAFMTAIYSLEKLARLCPGDTVLIHACAGGVGQAAIQVARARGATVYGTASPSKWSYVKGQGVEHVMSSRTLDFTDEILRITNGRGVDVVLNSLTGPFIARSADALAKGGRFVEIGKIGIWTAAEMAAHRPDIDYFSFDLGDVEGDGGLQAELLDAAVQGIESGRLAPLPVKSMSIRQAEAAFRHLAQAKNIGKVVLTLPAKEPSRGAVRADRSYLITGGLGALGLHVARSLVASGARQIVLAGRSEPDAAALFAIESLRSAGAQVDAVAMDVADASQAHAVVQRIEREMNPLGGVVHAAGTLDDGVIAKQTWVRFSRVLAPKVDGAWNLHVATRSSKLDFFVLFSSIASMMGAPGQASYAAANAFMDGLAALRRSEGLPATCVDWGPWAAGGMAEKTRAANRARFESFGLGRMSVEDNVEVFEHLLDDAPATVAVTDVDWAKYLKTVTSPGIARFYSLVAEGASRAGGDDAGALLERLAKEPDDRREAVLIDFLRRQVASVVGIASPDSIAVTQPLLDVGFDSLMAVELKSRVESSLGCTLGAALLFDHPTLEALARHLLVDVLHLRSARGMPERVEPSAIVHEAPREDDTAASAPLSTLRESFVEGGGGPQLAVCTWGAGGRETARGPVLPARGPDDAPLVVCVHGILDQAASWDEVAVGLVARGYRVVALDLRGHGRSAHHPANAAITVMDFLLDLTAVATSVTNAAGARAGAKRPFVLIGHSIGAAVASLFASAYPESVSRLILVEPVIPHLREQQGALDLLKNELRYMKEAPAHAAYPDVSTAARMLTLSHGGLSASRAAKLARRITEPCDGGVRWTWDARLRNPLGVDLCFSREHYLALLGSLAVDSTRIYGKNSQFAGTPVLFEPGARPGGLARSRSVTIAGGHNLHTDDAAALLDQVLVGLHSEDRRSPGEARE